jgi:hypothetical protein
VKHPRLQGVEKMNFTKKFNIYLWGTAILFGVLLPLIAVKLPLTRAMWVGLFLIVINCCYSVWLGGYLYRHTGRWWTLLVFPGLFLVAAFLFLPRYTMYFAAAYLAIVYLSCSLRKQN